MFQLNLQLSCPMGRRKDSWDDSSTWSDKTTTYFFLIKQPRCQSWEPQVLSGWVLIAANWCSNTSRHMWVWVYCCRDQRGMWSISVLWLRDYPVPLHTLTMSWKEHFGTKSPYQVQWISVTVQSCKHWCIKKLHVNFIYTFINNLCTKKTVIV